MLWCVILSFVVWGSPLAFSLPNFVFILTDDQDLLLNSVNYMKNTQKLVANQGLTFENFFVNSPICCPSRSTILTGKYPRNLQVFNNSIEGGCSSVHWQQNHEASTIAPILKSANNYKTFYAGKYLNQYGGERVGGLERVPPGYDWWLGLEGNSKYYNYNLSINGSRQFFANDYLTDKINDYAIDFLNQISSSDNFFLMLAPPACHSPFTPAPRHSNEFPALKTVRDPPFNVTPINKHWIVGMPPTQLPDNVTILDEIYRNRIRTLQAVDEMVGNIVTKLEEMQILENTYIIFTSDNGYHIGQFTQPWDKRQPYETDIRVPFLIRGPKIGAKITTKYPASTVDIAATILDLAGLKMVDTDGYSFKKQLFQVDNQYDKNIMIEYWGEGNNATVSPNCHLNQNGDLAECSPESWCKCQDSKNNTFSCVLTLNHDIHFKFCTFWLNNMIEAYNLADDPYEMNNLRLSKREIDYYTNILSNY